LQTGLRYLTDTPPLSGAAKWHIKRKETIMRAAGIDPRFVTKTMHALGFAGLDAWYYWANGAAVLLVVSLHKPEAVQVRMASA
jgi:hypothetical protein